MRVLFLLLLSLPLPGPIFAQGSTLDSTASADSFDEPLKKDVVDFGPSPYYAAGDVRMKLSCYMYPTFMVKEYDERQKGAEWLAIVPIEKGVTRECTKSHVQGEQVFEKEALEPEWIGYFLGAKENLVFFDA